NMLRKHWQDRGLGLAGMQERAALLDGNVEIESEPGAGALITVTIPLRPAAQASRPLAAEISLPGEEPRTPAAQTRVAPPLSLRSQGAPQGAHSMSHMTPQEELG
ncbi:MAG TPA: hypothetical protein VFX31_10455, partial [Ktedonobacterales bacterium]|nr:hypothetical protein [Ktedonobacterales bacterium]